MSKKRQQASCDKTFYTCEVLSCCSLVYDRNNSSCLDTGASLLLAICTARYCVDIGISTHRNIHDNNIHATKVRLRAGWPPVQAVCRLQQVARALVPSLPGTHTSEL